MKPRHTRDSKLISKKICKKEYCKKKAYAIISLKYLCEFHFRELSPLKERHFRHAPQIRANFEFVVE